MGNDARHAFQRYLTVVPGKNKVHLVQLQHLTSASTDAPFLQGCCISTSILTTALILTLLINILPISNSLLPPRPCPLPLPF